MNLKKIKKEWIFVKSLKLAKSNTNIVGKIILFDLMFFVSFFALQRLFQYFSKNLFFPNQFSSAVVLILLSLVYYLVILLLYSFFKYNILEFIKSLFEKTQISFNRFGQFYALNLMIAIIFFAIIYFLGFIISSVKQNYAPIVFVLLAIPYSLFLYVVINLSHSLFYQDNLLKESLKRGFSDAFAKIKAYRETILVMILAALILFLLFFGAGYLIRLLTSKNYSLYLTAYSYFKQISIIVLDVIIYLIILINRISFYYITKETR